MYFNILNIFKILIFFILFLQFMVKYKKGWCNMLNVLIADDNIYYVKNLVNFVISRNSNIKITGIASTGYELNLLS